MKKSITILLVFLSIHAIGQVKNDTLQTDFEMIELSIILDSCINISDWELKKDCSLNILNNRVQDLNDSDVFSKVSEEKCRVWIICTFGTEGKLISYQVQASCLILEIADLVKDWASMNLSDLRLMNEKGDFINGTYKFPLDITKY